MSQKTITRKKLLHEPDEFQSLSQRAWSWVQGHGDRAAMIAGVVLAVVLVGVGIKAWVERSKEQRAVEVATAVGRYTSAQGAAVPADLRHELAGLADRYAGSPEGAVARYLQAGSLAAGGEGDKARPIYEQLVKDESAAGDLAALSRVALAYLDLARGASDAALPAFLDLLKIQGTAVPRAQIMLEIAAIHEKLGRPAEARRVYQDLLAEHPDGSWSATAKERLRVLPGGTPAT